MNGDEKSESPEIAAPKQRDAVFDVAKGLSILVVLGHHSFSNSARLYTISHSPLWWVLSFANRILSFSVPSFLLISAVLSARSLIQKPAIGPFYKRRFLGILWPYLVWTVLYWCAHLVVDQKSSQIVTGKILGFDVTGPVYFVHVKERLLDIVWGKAYFHLYFLVVLLELLLVLPAAVAYVRWRKPGFWETLVTAFVVQGAILVVQHYMALLPFPASTALWYIGSLLPGAWIGANWELFKEQVKRFVWPLAFISVVSGGLFLREELKVMHGLSADNYTSNGSLTVYSSCVAILVLMLALYLAPRDRWKRVLDSLGKLSLQLYLIHPGIMLLLENQHVVSVLRPTHLGSVLSPILLLGITLGLIWLLRVCRLEKPLFGRG